MNQWRIDQGEKVPSILLFGFYYNSEFNLWCAKAQLYIQTTFFWYATSCTFYIGPFLVYESLLRLSFICGVPELQAFQSSKSIKPIFGIQKINFWIGMHPDPISPRRRKCYFTDGTWKVLLCRKCILLPYKILWYEQSTFSYVGSGRQIILNRLFQMVQ